MSESTLPLDPAAIAPGAAERPPTAQEPAGRAESEAPFEKSDQNLIWIDCEMTGLEPEVDRLIEIAVVVTGPNLTPRIEGPVLVIHQSDEQLAKMDNWNTNTHGASGLTAKVKASILGEAAAEQQLIDFLSKYVPKGASPMCGNSIGQDRRFLVKYMPRLEAFFHYRNLDVSTLKELAKRWRPEVAASFKKQQKHTALADAHESIEELVHYREHFLRLSDPATGD
ncbi:MAG: oligoribonuclease [Burkholderiales bacterium]